MKQGCVKQRNDHARCYKKKASTFVRGNRNKTGIAAVTDGSSHLLRTRTHLKW